MWCAAEFCPGATCALRLESLMPTALEQEQTLAATWEQIAVRQQKMTCHTHASPRHHRKGRKTSTSASAAYRCARLVHWGEGEGGESRLHTVIRLVLASRRHPRQPPATTFDAINSL